MRLRVVGSGAVGTLLAVRLAGGGHRVEVGARTAPPGGASELRYAIEGTDPAAATLRTVGPDPTGPPPDGVVLAVKAYDLEAAAGELGRAAAGPVLLVQNGLGIEELAARGARRAAGPGAGPDLTRSLLLLPATWLGPGRIRQPGPAAVLLPPAAPAGRAGSASLEMWAAALAVPGLAVRRPPGFEREIWRKLLVNAAVNPVTADHGVPNGRIAEEPWRGQALRLLGEARAVAAAEGFVFTEEEAERDLFAIVRGSADNRSSMLQDVDRGRRTEVDAISGAILDRGARHGLDLPATRRACERLRARGAAGLPEPPRKPS